jgi:hypothetical protein
MEIALKFFNNFDIKISILESVNDTPGGTTGPIDIHGGLKSVIVKYRLDFDNSDYVGRECVYLSNKYMIFFFIYLNRWLNAFTSKPIHLS